MLSKRNRYFLLEKIVLQAKNGQLDFGFTSLADQSRPRQSF
jgi:hypothetical protein